MYSLSDSDETENKRIYYGENATFIPQHFFHRCPEVPGSTQKRHKLKTFILYPTFVETENQMTYDSQNATYTRE